MLSLIHLDHIYRKIPVREVKRLILRPSMSMLLHGQKKSGNRKKDQMKEGFGIVLAKLGACGRPCVGHNAMFDCVYIVDKFLVSSF